MGEGYARQAIDEIAVSQAWPSRLAPAGSATTTLFDEPVQRAAAQSDQVVTDVIDATNTTPRTS